MHYFLSWKGTLLPISIQKSSSMITRIDIWTFELRRKNFAIEARKCTNDGVTSDLFLNIQSFITIPCAILKGIYGVANRNPP
jgi:hypothetical protein